MIVIDPEHLSDVDFNLYGITALSRSHGEGACCGYADRGRPDHGLYLIVSGSAIFTDDGGRSLSAGAGDVVYVPRGKRYNIVYSCGGKDASDILIDFMISDMKARELSLSDDILMIAQGVSGDITALFSKIVETSIGGGSVMAVKRDMYNLVDLLLIRSNEKEEACTIEQCVSYVNANYAKVDGIAPLAAMCGIGETAFRKRFREQMGMSPVHYINAVKVERACRMLCCGEITPAEVCEALGFYDLAYFHKVFKRYTDKTPGEYAAEHCGKGSGHRR